MRLSPLLIFYGGMWAMVDINKYIDNVMDAIIDEMELEYLYYWPDKTFTDINGYMIPNIFDFITVNDLYLFKLNPYRWCYFQHRMEPKLLCYIILQEDQDALEEHKSKK